MIVDIVLGKAMGRGGLETVLTLVTQELKRRGHVPRVFQMSSPDYEEWATTLPEIRYYDQGNDSLGENFTGEIDIFRYSLGYRNLLDQIGRPDIVLATHTPALSMICRLALSFYGEKRPPILSWLHGPLEAFGGGKKLKYSDAHLAISESLQNNIRETLRNDAEVYYVGNPIPDKDFPLIPRPTQSEIKLIFIGRIENHSKRLDVLFKSLSMLSGAWSLDIIGGGEDEQSLKKLSEVLKISDRVHWKGWKEEPWLEIKEASTLVLSSDYEGFGMVLIEALSRGVPVICTEVGSPNEIVKNGINGWLFPKGDSQALKDILQEILSGATELPSAENCVESISRYRVSNVIERFEQSFSIVRGNHSFIPIDVYSKQFDNVLSELQGYIEALNPSPTMDKIVEVVEFAKDLNVSFDSFAQFVETCLSGGQKDQILSDMAVMFWSEGRKGFVIPLLKKAYEINENNSDVLFNLGYVIWIEKNDPATALVFLEKIKAKNHEVQALINDIQSNYR